MVKSFHDLSEKEILALAISLEEEDGKIYGEVADRLKENFPSTASALEAMRQEESGHRRRLIDLFQERFGENIPLIRRQDVKGFVHRPAIWLNPTVSPQRIRNQVQTMESETYSFYQQALARTTDAGTRKLLGDLAETERDHAHFASDEISKTAESGAAEAEDESSRRLFVLQVVQPGLAGLMDGSVSTLAPVFAAAFATRNSWDAFLVGLAASVGAGISMGFAEALSDDGSLTGRGHPWVRGLICGAMTAVGGIGHTLPFLIRDFRAALWAAGAVVLAELGVITWIRRRYMDTPWVTAALQVGLGGVLVFITGVLIGSS